MDGVSRVQLDSLNVFGIMWYGVGNSIKLCDTYDLGT